MNFPTITLKSGVRIMTRPVLSEELPPEFQPEQPPGQPAVYLNFNECCGVAATLKGRLPTDAEWLEAFDAKPYNNGIVEWTATRRNADVILRGGDAPGAAGGCRSACRFAGEADGRDGFLGFRLAFDP